MKKIAIASLAQESNSFSPIQTTLEDFHILRRNKDITAKFSKAADIFTSQGFEVVTSISAYALPGGSVIKEDFITLAAELVNKIPHNVVGIWLMLHGAMFVEEINSGEEYLVALIREKFKSNIPIAVCMDMHANHTPNFINSVDIVRGYHTAPHEDWDYENCKAITATALVAAINGTTYKTFLEKCDLRLFGENFMTDFSPAKDAIAISDEIETVSGVVAATIFVGMAWVDCPYNTLSFVITVDESVTNQKELLNKMKNFISLKKNDFAIPAKNMLLPQAVDYCEKLDETHFYISDSGDNVTAGAAGDSVFCLEYLLRTGKTGYLVTGILDESFVDFCFENTNLPMVHLTLGSSKNIGSKQIKTDFIVLARFFSDVENVKDVKLVFAKVAQNYVIITNKRCSFTSEKIIEQFAGEISKYKAIFVKLGYLFPDLAGNYVIALTPGNACLDKKQIVYKNNQ